MEAVAPWRAPAEAKRANGREPNGKDNDGAPAAGGAPSLFLVSVFRDVAAGAVIFVWQEFSRHGELHAVALGVGKAFESGRLPRRYPPIILAMRPPSYPSIVRLGVRPDEPGAMVGPRRR